MFYTGLARQDVRRTPYGRASTSWPTRGAYTQRGDDPRLFDLTPEMDPFSEGDARPEDIFPHSDGSLPEDGNDAIARLYTFDNFRAAQARDSRTGYLQPVMTRNGWGRLGERTNYQSWLQGVQAVRDQIGAQRDVAKFVDDLMIPVPDQFLDVLTSEAERRGIQPLHHEEGIGGRAAFQLASEFEKETSGMIPSSLRTTADERRVLTERAMQPIPRSTPAAALRTIRDIAAARADAKRRKVYVPDPTPDHMQALADWVAVDADPMLTNEAYGLQAQVNLPLPPPTVRA